MQPSDLLGLIPYFIFSFDLAYLTTKWYAMWVFGLVVFPIHVWILKDTGYLAGLVSADLPYVLIVMGFLVAAGFLSYFCVVWGFNVSPVLPLIGFRDSFNTPSIALVHAIAQLAKIAWVVVFVLYFPTSPNFAITISAIIWSAVVAYQYFATRYIVNSIHNPHLSTPFRNTLNVSDYHLTYVILGVAAFTPLYLVNIIPAGAMQLPIVVSISFVVTLIAAVLRTAPLLRIKESGY